MARSFGAVLKQAREVRELSAVDTARAAGISATYLSKLENWYRARWRSRRGAGAG